MADPARVDPDALLVPQHDLIALIAGQIHHIRRQIRMSVLGEHDDAAEMPIDQAALFRIA
jgi:hypothetical protein